MPDLGSSRDLLASTAVGGDATTTGGFLGGPVPALDPQGVPQGPLVEREFTVRSRTQTQMVLRRFLAHKLAVASLVVFVLLLLAGFLGPRLWHYKFDEFLPGADVYNKPPSSSYPFGTDSSGHDMLALCLRGLQRSCQVALIVALLSTTFGTLIGAIAGFYRGRIDGILMRIVDLFLLFPVLVILIVLAHRVSSGNKQWLYISLIIAAFSWMPIARVVRGVFLSLREKEFVEAAHALGAKDSRIIWRHLIPNSLGPIIVNATITIAIAILTEAALSFIGFGIQSPDVSLGQLVNTYQTAYDQHWWQFFTPAILIIAVALTINLIGDGLRDAFDPQQRVRA